MNVARPFKSAEFDKSKEADLEGNIRELVRRDSTTLREGGSESEVAADSLSSLLYRVSGSSTLEIDNLINQLKSLREKLHADGNRVQRDIVEYAALSQSVMQLTKIISDGVTQVKKPEPANTHGADYTASLGAAARDI
jgi:hypothetical protein